MSSPSLTGIQWTAPAHPADGRVLSPEALAFVAGLARRFHWELELLLARREAAQRRYDGGERPGFDPATAGIREAAWTVAPLPAELQDRRVEITGPPERKLLINALNSGAQVHLSDFEDSLAPTPENLLEGQLNLQDAVRRRLQHVEGGKVYQLAERTAVLMVRPRGLHLTERHLRVDGLPVPAALFDAGLLLFHNAAELIARGSAPYLYLPKLEHHLEARWWNRVLAAAEAGLGLPAGRIRATVLIETLPAAFQMDEILHELRDRAAGLNLGRWDYLFSFIKVHRMDPRAVLPERGSLAMTLPFLRSCARRLVQVSHRRGCSAIGGMSAFVPVHSDPAATEQALIQVRADKLREVKDGCDGTWVAHPGLVAVARETFDRHLPGPNQIHRIPEGRVGAAELLAIPQGPRSDAGLRHNLRVGLRYLESWLRGQGCVALYGQMEDAATAEISRMQLWQWVKHEAAVQGHGPLDRTFFHRYVREALDQIQAEIGARAFEQGLFGEAADLFESQVTAELPDAFFTLPAYETLSERPALGETA